MTSSIVGVIGFLALVLLIGLRVHIGFSMALTGFIGFVYLTSFKAAFAMLALATYKTGASYALTVIPLFVLMGQLASQSRLGADFYQAVYRWVGSLPGGLCMATICACAGFAAISGSSLATAATMGLVALPEMRRYRYDDALATGCIAAGGTLGIMIPPSTVMVIYGIITEQPIGALFIAGIFPGLILTGLFLATIYLLTRCRPEMAPPGPRFTLREKVAALKYTWGVLAIFLLVMGGLYAGWFTATEAAAMGTVGVLIVTAVQGRLTKKVLIESLRESTLTTAMIFTILIGANIFGYFMATSELPGIFAEWITRLGLHRYAVLLIICIVYIILGCFMEGLAIMFLTLPIVFPVVMGLGFNPIWFGVTVTLLIEMGLITPPVGMNIYVISGVAKDVPMETIFRGAIPFFLAMVVCLFILLAFPDIALFLPTTMAK
jgi:C4-dicarboxylate transporter, DctM subunit